jgi:uncharacterized protein DUF6284
MNNVLPLNHHRSNPKHVDGPSAADLDAIETEMPLVLAEVELLDAHIAILDRAPNELDARRLRRAHRRVLAARVELANRTTDSPEVA